MAFFCPIFPKHNRVKAKEYEDSNYYSFDGGGRSLYSSRSMTALNFVPTDTEDSDHFQKLSENRFVLVNSDFEPTVDDELRVRRGEVVKALYRDREWVYVVRENDGEQQEGFIPFIFCQEIDPTNKIGRKNQLSIFKSAFSRRSARRSSDKKIAEEKKVDVRENSPKLSPVVENDQNSKSAIGPKALMNVDRFLRSLEENKNIPTAVDDSPSADYARIDKGQKMIFGRVTEFRKWPQGRLIAEFEFSARHEDDASVGVGEIVVLLNNEDPNWFWIRKTDGTEGFVPSNYVRKLDEGPTPTVPNQLPSNFVHAKSIDSDSSNSNSFNELMVVADFEPVAADDLPVIRGDWIYSYQTPALTDDTWLWAYCPRTKRYGFVPNSIVRTPTATVL